MSLKEKIKSVLDKYDDSNKILSKLQNVSATREEALSALRSINTQESKNFIKVINKLESQGGSGMKGGKSFFKSLWSGIKRAFSADGLNRSFKVALVQLGKKSQKWLGMSFSDALKQGVSQLPIPGPIQNEINGYLDDLNKTEDRLIGEYEEKKRTGRSFLDLVAEIQLRQKLQAEWERKSKDTDNKIDAAYQKGRKQQEGQEEKESPSTVFKGDSMSDAETLRRGQARDKKKGGAKQAEKERREFNDPWKPLMKIERYRQEENSMRAKAKLPSIKYGNEIAGPLADKKQRGGSRIKMLPKGRMKGGKFPNILAEPNAAVKGRGLIKDARELKKCKDKADKFKKDHPRTSKLIGLGQSGLAGEDKNDGSKGVIPVRPPNAITQGDDRGAHSGWQAIGQSPNASGQVSVRF